MPVFNESGSGGILLGGSSGHSLTINVSIYPQRFPQTGTFPAIVYRLKSNRHGHHLGGASKLSRAIVQLDILAETEQEKVLVANKTAELLHQYRGLLGNVVCQNATLLTRFDNDVWADDGSDKLLFVKVMEFAIWYEETRPVLNLDRITSTEELEQSLVGYLDDLAPIYPGRVPERHNPAAPCIVYERMGGANLAHLNAASRVHDPTFNLTIRSARYRDTCLLANQVRERLQGLSGQLDDTMALSVVLENEADASAYQTGGDSLFYSINQEWKLIVED